MHKILPIIGFSFLSQAAFSQIPSGYYNNAYSGGIPKTCATLKTALFQIITADTTNLFYNSPDGSFDTQDAVNKLDIHRNDGNTANIIWDMYTDNPAGRNYIRILRSPINAAVVFLPKWEPVTTGNILFLFPGLIPNTLCGATCIIFCNRW
jgi:hypothetical protein